MFAPIAFGLFGLIIGSFLNVLVLRWDVRPLTGRSTCRGCGKVLAWYDLIPILSWVYLRGRCRSCGARISIQYVLVEAGTAAVFIVLGLAPLPLYIRVLSLPVAALLIAITTYDLREMLIPDAWVYVFAGLALFISLVPLVSEGAYQNTLYLLLSGPAVAAPLFGLWFFSQGRWMGFGDVKLSVGIGWLLGLVGGLEALFLAFILGALVSIPLLFFSSPLWRRMRASLTPRGASHAEALAYTMKSEIPFGPFLVASCFILWFIQMYGIALPQLFA